GWYHAEAVGQPKENGVDLAVTTPAPEPAFRDDSPFGIVAPPLVESEWPLFGEVGVAWVQWSAPWAYMEIQPGLYWHKSGAPKYADYDGFIKNANKYGVRTLLQIRTTPRWANKGKIGSFKDAGETRTDAFPPDEEHWGDLEKFVGEVVDRYKPLGVNH